MSLIKKIQKLNGWQRLFVVLAGFYLIGLVLIYINICVEEKNQVNERKNAVLLTVLDKISPLPQVPQDYGDVYFNALTPDPKQRKKIFYYTPPRTNLTEEQNEAVNKLSHKSYLLQITGKASNSFTKEINKLEDYDHKWIYFLLLSIPVLLLAWLLPCSLVYFIGFLSVWIYQGFKKAPLQ